MSEALAAAIEYRRGGMSVLPIGRDKAPALREWKHLQSEPFAEEDLPRVFGPGFGVAIIGGRVSGGLEIIDLESIAPIAEWCGAVRAAAPGLLERLPIVVTPTDGRHAFLRSEAAEGNQVLAKGADGKVLIETRGAGGYVLAPGCPPCCHPSGGIYRHASGPPIAETPVICLEERAILFDCGRSFNEYVHSQPGPDAAESSGRPGDDFNQRATWNEILELRGWKPTPYEGGRVAWTRPGKETGLSATTGFCRSRGGQDLFFVFSTSATPFEGGRCYSKFSAFALLEHGGDFAAAARALAGAGYGSRKDHAGGAPSPGTGLVVVTVGDVEREKVEWLWRHRIPLGKLTVLDGDPGLGKSTVTLDLAARVSTGRPMPGEEAHQEPGHVVLLSAEDGIADTIRPRLEAAGAALDRVHVFEAIRESADRERPPSIPMDVARLAWILGHCAARLLVVDPLMAFLSSDKDSHRDQDVRSALHPFSKLAESSGAAILIIRHLNKLTGGNPLYRGGGSIGIIGAARAGLLVAQDPEDKDRRVLAQTKSNLGPPAGSLLFRLETIGDTARVKWEGPTKLNAEDVLNPPQEGGEGMSEALEEAVAFLQDFFADGESHPPKEVFKAAGDAGISVGTVKAAKKALGIISKKKGLEGGWDWIWPGWKLHPTTEAEPEGTEP